VPETGKSFTADEARAIGQEIGIDWAISAFDVAQFRIGMNASSNTVCSTLART
jgi:hypothetical protein